MNKEREENKNMFFKQNLHGKVYGKRGPGRLKCDVMAEKPKNMVFQNIHWIIHRSRSKQGHHSQDDCQYSEQILRIGTCRRRNMSPPSDNIW